MRQSMIEARERRELAPTASRLVAAARRLLGRDGFSAITVEAVAAEAGEYRDSVRYYFGSKAGLIAAVVDSLSNDQTTGTERCLDKLSSQQRLRAVLEADHRLAEDGAAFKDFFHILPHVLRDEELRSRVAVLYDWYREQYLQCFGTGQAGARRDEQRRLASLMCAVIDGLAIQKALAPGDVDLGPLFEQWERMLRAALAPKDELAAGAGAAQEGDPGTGAQATV